MGKGRRRAKEDLADTLRNKPVIGVPKSQEILYAEIRRICQIVCRNDIHLQNPKKSSPRVLTSLLAQSSDCGKSMLKKARMAYESIQSSRRKTTRKPLTNPTP